MQFLHLLVDLQNFSTMFAPACGMLLSRISALHHHVGIYQFVCSLWPHADSQGSGAQERPQVLELNFPDC